MPIRSTAKKPTPRWIFSGGRAACWMHDAKKKGGSHEDPPFSFTEQPGSASRAATSATWAVLTAREEGETFEEGDVLLVL